MNSAIENVRNQKLIGTSLEAEVYIYIGDKSLKNMLDNIEMKKILIISKFLFLNSIDEKVEDFLYKETIAEENIVVIIKKTNYFKCLRCWQFEKEVTENESLCSRCKKTLENNV